MDSVHADQSHRPADELALRLDSSPTVEWTDELRTQPEVDPLPLRGEFPRPSDAPDGPRVVAWVTLAGILAAGLFASYHYWSSRRAATGAVALPAAPVTTSPAPAAIGAPTATTRLGGDVPALDLPPLDQSDAAVAALVKALSSHPRVAAWLTTDGLIRNFTVVVENIAAGKTPAMHLRVLAPATPFQAGGLPDRPTVDPRSYRRYDTLAAAVASIDPAGAARLYGGLRPRIDEAYRDLGHETSFDVALERAIVLVLDTPLPDGTVRLSRPEKGIAYPFEDPRMEGLTAAQKQLVRMGPDNARRIQQSLRSIALALGIPADRLPAPR